CENRQIHEAHGRIAAQQGRCPRYWPRASPIAIKALSIRLILVSPMPERSVFPDSASLKRGLVSAELSLPPNTALTITGLYRPGRRTTNDAGMAYPNDIARKPYTLVDRRGRVCGARIFSGIWHCAN